MATEIIMPKAGMAMEKGTIVQWFKTEGEAIKEGEVLLEIITDKVNMEVEAESTGILLQILAVPGEVVPVLKTIGYIGALGEVPLPNPSAAAVETSKPVKQTEKPAPVAAKRAQEAKATDAYDVIVIGGGPAGYSAAIKAAILGGKVALVEKDVIGGTCLNRGCIPTKTYMKNVEILDSIRHGANRGIHFNDTAFNLDMPKIVDYKNQVVKTLTTGVAGLLKQHGVQTFKDRGEVREDRTVMLSDGTVLRGEKLILATGSSIIQLRIPGIESSRIINSDEIMDLAEVPDTLVIVGGGVIGCEFAEIFNAYGTRVVIVEMADVILPMFDPEISAAMTDLLIRKGIHIKTGVAVKRFIEGERSLSAQLSDGSAIEAETVLVATGRSANLDGLEKLNLKTNRGAIVVDGNQETSIAGIYAPGDVNGRIMLAHAAMAMGEAAAANAMGHSENINLSAVPSCVYTQPEIAAIGLTEEQSRSRGAIKVGRFAFAANGRALATGETLGLVKVILDDRTAEILGVHIIGAGAVEMINVASVMMNMEITGHEIHDTIIGHPSFSEAFMEACKDALGESIHMPPKQ